MKRYCALLAGIVALAPLPSAFAATFTDWSTAVRITVDDDQTNIYISGAIANPNSCSETDYIAIPATTANYEAITAAAMSAVAGSFEVRMRIDETACFASRPKADFVSFRN